MMLDTQFLCYPQVLFGHCLFSHHLIQIGSLVFYCIYIIACIK